MEILCDLEVVVNGQKIFWVNKSIVISFSRKLRRLLRGKTKTRVEFDDFPGGSDGFELMTSFCYNNGKIEVSHSNIVILNSLANYMEMESSPHGEPGLLAQTEKFVEGVDFWTWSELLQALKQAPNQRLPTASSAPHVLKILVDELVRRLALIAADPSSKCTSFRSSCDSIRSTVSAKAHSSFRSSWFFDDLLVLDIDVVNMVVNGMLTEKFEHSTVSKFLFHYQKSGLFGAAEGSEKVRILQGLINLLTLLDKRSVPIKMLFQTMRKASHLKLSKSITKQLEVLIGSQLDQATLDDLLVPSPSRKGCVYDVNRVIRLLKIFLVEHENRWKKLPLKRMGRLIDLYAMEIAPDSFLKPSKFAAVVVALPDSARDSCDRIYHAIDLYLEAHQWVYEEERTRVASALNYEKLSPEVLTHLGENINFPVTARFKALIYQDLKLNNPSKCVYDHLKVLANWWGHAQGSMFRFNKKDVAEYVKARDERARGHVLKQMGLEYWDLERQFGRKPQEQMGSKFCCSQDVIYLPKLCS